MEAVIFYETSVYVQTITRRNRVDPWILQRPVNQIRHILFVFCNGNADWTDNEDLLVCTCKNNVHADNNYLIMARKYDRNSVVLVTNAKTGLAWLKTPPDSTVGDTILFSSYLKENETYKCDQNVQVSNFEADGTRLTLFLKGLKSDFWILPSHCERKPDSDSWQPPAVRWETLLAGQRMAEHVRHTDSAS